jgi:hypothetical protein
MRIHKKRGYRGFIFGVITDLSRIVCMKLEGSEGHMHIERTCEMGGAAVQDVMTAFANSTPEELGM